MRLRNIFTTVSSIKNIAKVSPNPTSGTLAIMKSSGLSERVQQSAYNSQALVYVMLFSQQVWERSGVLFSIFMNEEAKARG